jgi:hypothetical protein
MSEMMIVIVAIASSKSPIKRISRKSGRETMTSPIRSRVRFHAGSVPTVPQACRERSAPTEKN